jgi:hypothetical protein
LGPDKGHSKAVSFGGATSTSSATGRTGAAAAVAAPTSGGARCGTDFTPLGLARKEIA